MTSNASAIPIVATTKWRRIGGSAGGGRVTALGGGGAVGVVSDGLQELFALSNRDAPASEWCCSRLGFAGGFSGLGKGAEMYVRE